MTGMRLRRDVLWRIENQRLWLLDPQTRRARFYRADVTGYLDENGNVDDRMLGSPLLAALRDANLLEFADDETTRTTDALPARIAGGHGPLNVTVQVTDACNLRCGHCHNRERGARRIAPSQFRTLVTELRAMRVFNVNVSGGEPLLHPNVVELVSTVHSAGLNVTMSSNATRITDELAEELSLAGLRQVHVSLDSSVPSEHDGLRGRRGSYADMTRGLSRLRSHAVEYTLVTTLSNQSVESYGETLDRSFSLGASAHKTNLVIPQGRASRDAGPTREQIGRWAEVFRRKRAEYEGRMRVLGETMFLMVSSLSATGLGDGGRPVCPAGVLTCGIDATGDVHPCSFFTGHTIGNSFGGGGFPAVWNSEAWTPIRTRTTSLGGQGGCAARAYGCSGALDAADPLA